MRLKREDEKASAENQSGREDAALLTRSLLPFFFPLSFSTFCVETFALSAFPDVNNIEIRRWRLLW